MISSRRKLLTTLWVLTAAVSSLALSEDSKVQEVCDANVSGDRTKCQAAELDKIKLWWGYMSGQKPVKCRDPIWDQGPVPEDEEELNIASREIVFQTCRPGKTQYLLDVKGNIYRRSTIFRNYISYSISLID